MKRFNLMTAAAVLGLALTQQVVADTAGGFAGELLSLQQEFDRASFGHLGKSERKDAFAALVEHAADLSERYPDRVEALAWNGIVLSTYAGEVSAMSAMKYAKAARESLAQAEAMDPAALDGGIYASLGALYSKVPGGFVGFGDDALAAEYFAKALAVDGDNIDNNYFYGEFLIDQEEYGQALSVLNHALSAPPNATRPLFNEGRREAIRELIEQAEHEIS